MWALKKFNIIAVICLVTLTEISNGEDGQRRQQEEEEILREQGKQLMESVVYNFFAVPKYDCYAKVNRVQRHFHTIKSSEFNECLRATVDSLFDRVNIANVNTTDTESVDQYAIEFCKIITNVYKCIEYFAPSQRVCLGNTERLGMRKLFRFLPELKDVMCANNAETLSLLVENMNEFECVRNAGYEIHNITMLWHELIMVDEAQLFGQVKSCFVLQNFRAEMLIGLKNCSDNLYRSIERVLHRLWDKAINCSTLFDVKNNEINDEDPTSNVY